MTIDHKGLAVLIQEASTLSRKARLSPQEERRNAWLLSSISVIKTGGITLAELDEQDHNERARDRGLPTVQLTSRKQLTEEEVRATAFQALVERRDMTEGNLGAQLGSYTGLGYFVPTGFFPELFRALKAHDCLFDEDCCTLIKTTNGSPLPIPLASDTGSPASVVSEAGSQTSVDFDSTSHVVLGAYSYASRRFVASLEAFQDLSSAVSMTALANTFFQDALARGIGADLVNGTGGGVKPLGLIPSLVANAAPVVTATGSAANDGGAGTGANSLGSPDFTAALAQLNTAYFGPKTAWIMNKATLATVAGQLDKYGNIVRIIEYVDGQPTIFGIPVKIAPSMDSIGASKVPVVLGDFRCWATRLITADEGVGLKTYSEAPGLIEKGNVGIRCFTRADGALLWNALDSPAGDAGSPSPFVMIQNHS
jgi:HK97 family phage major capsid protein